MVVSIDNTPLQPAELAQLRYAVETRVMTLKQLVGDMQTLHLEEAAKDALRQMGICVRLRARLHDDRAQPAKPAEGPVTVRL